MGSPVLAAFCFCCCFTQPNGRGGTERSRLSSLVAWSTLRVSQCPSIALLPGCTALGSCVPMPLHRPSSRLHSSWHTWQHWARCDCLCRPCRGCCGALAPLRTPVVDLHAERRDSLESFASLDSDDGDCTDAAQIGNNASSGAYSCALARVFHCVLWAGVTFCAQCSVCL